MSLLLLLVALGAQVVSVDATIELVAVVAQSSLFLVVLRFHESLESFLK